jgi:hypothetical protein
MERARRGAVFFFSALSPLGRIPVSKRSPRPRTTRVESVAEFLAETKKPRMIWTIIGAVPGFENW